MTTTIFEFISRGPIFHFGVPPDDAPNAPSTQWNTEKPQRFSSDAPPNAVLVGAKLFWKIMVVVLFRPSLKHSSELPGSRECVNDMHVSIPSTLWSTSIFWPFANNVASRGPPWRMRPCVRLLNDRSVFKRGSFSVITHISASAKTSCPWKKMSFHFFPDMFWTWSWPNWDLIQSPEAEASRIRSKSSRARKPWSANCELKHWNFRGWTCLIQGLHFTV